MKKKQAIKHILCWLILLFAVFCLTTPCSAEEASLSKSKYPDIWYQSFEKSQEKIHDVFFLTLIYGAMSQ